MNPVVLFLYQRLLKWWR